jgi:hypothetical protein
MMTEERVVQGRAGRDWLAATGIAALAVITVTTVAQSTGRFHWWAGFVLVPSAISAVPAGPMFARGGGRAFTGYVIACAGALGFAVGALLMFGEMGRGWPLMIILPALAITGTYVWRPAHPLARAFHRAIATLALGAAALGVTFFLLNTGTVDFGESDWWGWFMMLAAVTVALNGLELLRHRIEYRLQAIALAVWPAVIVFLLGLRMVRGDWPY